ISAADAMNSVFGYATGLDMTRRDLQLDARAKGRPWDTGKAFERSAIISKLVLAKTFGEIKNQKIELRLNGRLKQSSQLDDLIWSVPELISHLSYLYHLGP